MISFLVQIMIETLSQLGLKKDRYFPMLWLLWVMKEAHIIFTARNRKQSDLALFQLGPAKSIILL